MLKIYCGTCTCIRKYYRNYEFFFNNYNIWEASLIQDDPCFQSHFQTKYEKQIP